MGMHSSTRIRGGKSLRKWAIKPTFYLTCRLKAATIEHEHIGENIMPEKITISLLLDIEVGDSEEKSYYLSNTGPSGVSPSCIADLFDSASNGDFVGKLLRINGVTQEDVRKLLNAQLGI